MYTGCCCGPKLLNVFDEVQHDFVWSPISVLVWLKFRLKLNLEVDNKSLLWMDVLHFFEKTSFFNFYF